MLIIPTECERWIEVQRPQGDYQKEIVEDFRMIEPYLPEKVDSILDIGCGMAGIDVLLKQKYQNARLELLDGDGKHKEYGFVKNYKPYNSRSCTEKMLKANGVSLDRWHDIGANEDLKADLVISLLSWGFHYPLSTYNVSGFCIADLRSGNEPIRGTVIAKMLKSSRCAFRC